MAKTAPTPRPVLAQQQWWRGWINVLDLWWLCGNAACRRARGCRGDARACFAQNFHLLPDGVRDWFIGLMAAKEADVPFDEAIRRLDCAACGRAWHDWNDAVASSLESSTSPRARGEGEQQNTNTGETLSPVLESMSR